MSSQDFPLPRSTRCVVSGQGALGDRGCGCGGSLVAVLVAVCLFIGLMVAMNAQPPAPAGPTREQVHP